MKLSRYLAITIETIEANAKADSREKGPNRNETGALLAGHRLRPAVSKGVTVAKGDDGPSAGGRLNLDSVVAPAVQRCDLLKNCPAPVLRHVRELAPHEQSVHPS
jgi:hypothetical protein